MQREQEHAVDVLAGEVVVERAATLRGLGEQQHQLTVGLGQRGADAADDAGEERLTEHPLLGLRDHERDGVGAPGDQGPGGGVGHVAELGDRLLDGLARLLGDLLAAVDDPGRRTATDPGARSDLVRASVGCAGCGSWRQYADRRRRSDDANGGPGTSRSSQARRTAGPAHEPPSGAGTPTTSRRGHRAVHSSSVRGMWERSHHSLCGLPRAAVKDLRIAGCRFRRCSPVISVSDSTHDREEPP